MQESAWRENQLAYVWRGHAYAKYHHEPKDKKRPGNRVPLRVIQRSGVFALGEIFAGRSARATSTNETARIKL